MNIPGRTFLTGESFYSDWMPRGGDDAIFRAQLIAQSGTPDSAITIYTKNREEDTYTNGLVVQDSTPDDYDFGFNSTGTPSVGDTSQVIVQSTTGGATGTSRGLLELVRFKITVTGDPDEYQTIRIFPPVWMDRGITT